MLRIASSICEVRLGFYYTALVSQTLVLHEWVCLANHGRVIDEPQAYQGVCVIQAPATLYKLALGTVLVSWFTKPCCFSSGSLT